MYLLGGWCGNCRGIGKPKTYEMPLLEGPMPELYFRITDANDCGSSRVVTEMTKPLSREHARRLVTFVYDLAAPKRKPKKPTTRKQRSKR